MIVKDVITQRATTMTQLQENASKDNHTSFLNLSFGGRVTLIIGKQNVNTTRSVRKKKTFQV